MSLLPSFSRSIGFGTGWSQVALDAGEGSVMPVFEARVMNQAISENDGQATDPNNLGAVHYSYDDMVNNDGKVTLPYG